MQRFVVLSGKSIGNVFDGVVYEFKLVPKNLVEHTSVLSAYHRIGINLCDFLSVQFKERCAFKAMQRDAVHGNNEYVDILLPIVLVDTAVYHIALHKVTPLRERFERQSRFLFQFSASRLEIALAFVHASFREVISRITRSARGVTTENASVSVNQDHCCCCNHINQNKCISAKKCRLRVFPPPIRLGI